ncbi:GEM-like protein 2 [Syzygium oleosum]|uniref:GEM-like protein 2 n=1 Tax=Syzygium oleosum TaxID=219896 RepID=UPI0024BB0CEB|nr:GEM-like protein 2 [Syzygium oleosum]
MSGGGEPVVTRCSTYVVGTPVEPQAHPASQHAATWIAGEARPASFRSSYMNATPSGSASGFANPNQSSGGGGENPYVHVAPLNASAPPGRSPMNKICDALNRCGKRFEDASRKAEVLADNVWHHLRTSPNITDAAMARLAQGTKVLTEGGQDKVFQHKFEILPGEKLLKAYACYLSTSTGPVIGTLYLSNKRLAFCSDNPLCQYSPTGQQQWMYYKVVLLLDQLSTVSPSSNRLNPSEKYILVVTRDGYEFWFMGFISYNKALKNINEALQHHWDNHMAGRIQVQ